MLAAIATDANSGVTTTTTTKGKVMTRETIFINDGDATVKAENIGSKSLHTFYRVSKVCVLGGIYIIEAGEAIFTLPIAVYDLDIKIND